MKRGRGGGGLDAIENRRIKKERGHLRAAAPFGLVFRVVLVAVSRRVLGCGARARSAKVCGAATAAPQCIKAALVYAKHTPWCQTVKISEFIIVLPIIFLDRISSI